MVWGEAGRSGPGRVGASEGRATVRTRGSGQGPGLVGVPQAPVAATWGTQAGASAVQGISQGCWNIPGRAEGHIRACLEGGAGTMHGLGGRFVRKGDEASPEYVESGLSSVGRDSLGEARGPGFSPMMLELNGRSDLPRWARWFPQNADGTRLPRRGGSVPSLGSVARDRGRSQPADPLTRSHHWCTVPPLSSSRPRPQLPPGHKSQQPPGETRSAAPR